ncbi:MAG TPA: DUF2752 domain-containing protein [Candidatus Limnocylindria bacterium]|nr:DUF2752 domain-containing protein [Candidatus Limnocylindria bacterium]
MRRRLAAPLVTGAAVAASFALVGLVDPHEPGRYPVCPTLSVLGIYCPLCGGLRAANDLTRLDVVGAAGSNLLVVLMIPVAMVLWVLWVRDRARGSTRDLVRLSDRQLWVAGGVLVLFMLLRNLPFGAVLAP